MTGEGLLIASLDANVLAKPVTRTLLLRCMSSGYTLTWGPTAEAEAGRHRTDRQSAVAEVRAVAGLMLGVTGVNPERFVGTAEADRQILSDAEAAGARFLITEDVDDFAVEDLRLAGVSAVNPDVFLAERADRASYERALEVMVSGMRNPSRTAGELHAAIARQHPRLFQRHHDLYDVPPQATGHAEPAVLFRGLTCLRCLMTQDDEDTLVLGVCSGCR